ncbi:ATP-dependent helicase HepA [Thermoplasmatales archaeon]|nr:ATP-dependent helicase HepA [Thermoplasmatales archaeon]
MSRIIDNGKDKLSESLNLELKDVSELAFASAYFNIKGFGLIKDTIRDKPLKFLLGRPQDESVTFEEEIVRELEEQEDNPEYYTLMNDTVTYFSDDKREIRKKNGPFFHGKAYIGVSPNLSNPKTGIGIVGSSNLTYAGLKTNSELNVENTDRELLKEITIWFNEKWQSAEEYKSTFIGFLKNYTITHTPYEVASKALFEYYNKDLQEAEKIKMMGLKRFQVVSVLEARKILSEYKGVVIADSTGLGKTRTMIALAHEARKERKKVLLIAPKSVLRTTWEKETDALDTKIEGINSEYISANPDEFVEKYENKGNNFIMVDEAHYFKSSSSNRYKALRDLILHNSAEVVLATATPVNNSLMDLYNLIALFAPEESIMDIAGVTLKGYFGSNQKLLLEGKSFEMSQVLERFVVRHSRKFAKMLEKDMKGFPERVIDMNPKNRYKSNMDYQTLDDKLERLYFAPYELSVEKLTELKLPSGQAISQFKEREKKEKLKELVKTIVRLNLFKRLESSQEAFRETMGAISSYMKRAMEFARTSGYFLPRSAADDPLFDFDEEIPPNIFESDKYRELQDKCLLTKEEKEYFLKACSEDLKSIKEILNSIPSTDAKLIGFQERVRELIPQIKEPNGVVFFTQYTATAKLLYNSLNGLYPLTYLTSGSICKDHKGRISDTTKIVEQFQEHGGLLISTDVLSEGQNLQNAQFVVNYDFPWNPVVLIQRVGRIDRMGSNYDYVYLINIMQENDNPEDPNSLQHFINLMRKLYSKISGIKNTVGIDAPILGEDAEPKDFGTMQKLIAEGKSTVLTELEKEIEQFTNDPKDQLMEIIDDLGEERIKAIPRGIGAYKKYEKNGLFCLFTDGENYYWRLKFEGESNVITDPGQIVGILLKDKEKDSSGEKIEYKVLVDKLRKLKEETTHSVESDRVRRSSSSTLPNLSKNGKEIYAKISEEDEELALKFRAVASKEALVKSLYEAMKDPNFIEKARKLILSQSEKSEPETRKELSLKRVCWCLLTS